AAAGDDTAFAQQKKDALGSAVRLNIQRLQSDTIVQRWQRTRFTRDSTQRALAADSAVLARVEASSASRRARGARLAPADQQSFSRDSSARARAVPTVAPRSRLGPAPLPGTAPPPSRRTGPGLAAI